MAARDCGMNRPCSHSGEPKASNGASSTRPSGSRSAGRAGTGSSSRVGLQRVDAERGLGGLVSRRHQRPRLVGPERVEPQIGDPLRVRVPERRLGGRAVGKGSISAGASRAARRSTALTRPAPAREARLGQLDRLADRRVRGHAVQERELEHAEPQGGEHGGLEPLDRPPGQLFDHVVERRAALDDSVDEPRGQRAVARFEAPAAGLAVQRAVRVGSLLEDPPNDRIRAGASG